MYTIIYFGPGLTMAKIYLESKTFVLKDNSI